ncbi:MAG: hypothetical protein JWP10_610 [Nocardioidaceae bacterium]|nr:hypothetical protein [Nocardioidaceae bacterium]
MHKSRMLGTMGIIVSALIFSACGSSSSDGGADKPKGSGFSAEAVAAAKASLETASKVPSARKLTPLAKRPSTDVSVVLIGCPIPQCTEAIAQAKQGAKDLGWNAKEIVADFTPEAFVGAFNTALQTKPDFIYYIATQPVATIDKQLQEAKAAGIPVIAGSPAPDVKAGGDSPIAGITTGPALTVQFTELMADVVIADAKSTEGIVFMFDPAAPSYVQGSEVFKKKITAAGGKVEPLEINQGEAGTTLPGKIVSYLQAHPKTKYIVAGNDLMFNGVPDAIKSAGLPLPKLIGNNATDVNRKYIADGDQFATVTSDNYGSLWDAIDLMARLSVGETLDPIEPLGESMVVKKANLAQEPKVLFPGAPQSYLTAWKVQ